MNGMEGRFRVGSNRRGSDLIAAPRCPSFRLSSKEMKSRGGKSNSSHRTQTDGGLLWAWKEGKATDSSWRCMRGSPLIHQTTTFLHDQPALPSPFYGALTRFHPRSSHPPCQTLLAQLLPPPSLPASPLCPPSLPCRPSPAVRPSLFCPLLGEVAAGGPSNRGCQAALPDDPAAEMST